MPIAKFFTQFRSSAFVRNESGATAIVFAVMAVTLFGTMGLAVDYSMWAKQKAELQAAADAAALAGATKLAKMAASGDNVSSSEAQKIAAAFVQEKVGNGITSLVQVDSASGQVSVDLTTAGTQYVSQILTSHSVEINARGVARALTETAATACIIALDPNSTVGINFGLSGSMTANGCAIWSNSTSSTSINANGSGDVTAAATCAAGGIQKFGINFTPAIKSNCPPVLDPLAAWTPPSISLACTDSDLTFDSADVVLNPGVYCGGIKANGTMTVTLNPGLYVFSGGDVRLSAGASIQGSEVTLWFTGAGAKMDMGGSANVSLSAPTSGDWEGILIGSARDETASEIFKVRGNASLNLEGNIYLPTHHLSYAGGPDAILPPNFTVLIAGTIGFGGNSRLELRSDYASSSVPAFTAPASTTARSAVLVE